MKFYHFQDVFLLKYYGFEVDFCVKLLASWDEFYEIKKYIYYRFLFLICFL
jgi:hypothetical protein